MEFAGVAIGILAVVVVYAIGDVGCLLNLRNEASRTDGMHPTCRQEEDVSLLYFVFFEAVGKGIVLHRFHIGFRSDVFFETGIKKCSRRCFNDVPHFGLPERSVPFSGQRIIGMNLNGQVVSCVNKLDEQRKGVAVLFIHLPANQLIFLADEQFPERCSGERPVGNDRQVVFDS